MDNTIEKLYALRAQMSAADLPLDAIDEKIRIAEEKASSWQRDLDEISSSLRAFIQPIIKKWGNYSVDFHARFKDSELSTLLLNVDGKDLVIFQDPEDVIQPIPHSKRMKEAIEVQFPDGTVIFESQASVTLGKVIEKIGPERVEPLQIQSLLSRDPNVFKAYQTIGDGFYVNTYSNTETKRKHLEEISRVLGLGLIVKVVPGVYKSHIKKPLSLYPRATEIETAELLKELETGILNISPDIAVDKSLKSYIQFTQNSVYVANVLSRKKFIRIMLNDEYDRLKGFEGVEDAPDAHYGHMNRRIDVRDHKGVTLAIDYITKMLSIPQSDIIPNKIRIRLDKSSAH